jgi:hypothetical protein
LCIFHTSLTEIRINILMMASNGIKSEPRIQLAGRVIAITGANRGIGLGIATSCLENGVDHVYSIDIGDAGDDVAAVN